MSILKIDKKIDVLFKLSRNIRALVNISMKSKFSKKSKKTTDILGCDFTTFQDHLESKFEDWMNWENYGKYNGTLEYGWDIDHIIPVSSAKTEEDLLLLNHYTNLKPLCSYINRVVKRNKIE